MALPGYGNPFVGVNPKPGINSVLNLYDLNSYDARDGIFRLWGVDTMPADALDPKFAKASTGMVLAV